MSFRYCGREFSKEEVDLIKGIIKESPKRTRHALSFIVCDKLKWHKINGGPKDVSCRVAMLRMERDGLIELPPARPAHRTNDRKYTKRTSFAEPSLTTITAPVNELGDITTHLIQNRFESHLWNEYIERYHYLGYKKLPGAQLRYFIKTSNQIIALLGFGASAWKIAPRDQFIGWGKEQRKKKLHLIVNNARFLILPWIKSKNLATKILSLIGKRISDDWQKKYHYKPVLLETFVEVKRFQGTSYKAANWIFLGNTKGRGKKDTHNEAKEPIKSIWIYPLEKKFQHILCR